MTRKRYDEHSTEFGLWLRGDMPNQQTDVTAIDSRIGKTSITNLDYVILNYATGDIMLIEEKRYDARPRFSQKNIFQKLHEMLKRSNDKSYKGFHLLRFENTNPEDGKIYLDDKRISATDLVEFIGFQKPKYWYVNDDDPTP